MSQVRLKVRYNTLLLREFTVADLVRATGLNPESIRTELQRMKQQGLLSTHRLLDKPKKQGGQPALYRLADDPEARLALSQSIEALYPPLPQTDRPTSRFYESAQRLLDQALSTEISQREGLLSIAEHDLDMAEQSEGGDLASEKVLAYLQYERARLAYLHGEYEVAQQYFKSLQSFFTGIHDEIMTGQINEFMLCIQAWRQFAKNETETVDEVIRARWLLDALAKNDYHVQRPLTALLVQTLYQLLQTTDDIVQAAVSETMISSRERDEISQDVRQQRLLQKLLSKIGIGHGHEENRTTRESGSRSDSRSPAGTSSEIDKSGQATRKAVSPTRTRPQQSRVVQQPTARDSRSVDSLLPKQLEIDALIRRCVVESDRFYRGQPHDTRFVYELFRRALVEGDQVAWEYIYAHYSGLVESWVRRSGAFASSGESSEFFVALAFTRFWRAISPERFTAFPTLPSLLHYLQLCTGSVVIDSVRAQSWSEMLPEEAIPLERSLQTAPDEEAIEHVNRQEFWSYLDTQLSDEAERTVVFDFFVLGMKAGDIYERRRDLFSSVKDVYNVKRNVLGRLSRSSELRQLLAS
jgi:hypothetical protein